MKIKISEPESPYSAEFDPGVMDVTLEEVFNGVTFVTKDGEHLHVYMRDSGFEIIYFANEEVRTKHRTVIKLNGGNIEAGAIE